MSLSPKAGERASSGHFNQSSHSPTPSRPWVQILSDAKDEFEVDDFSAVFSIWRVEVEDPLDIGDVDITEGIYDERANQIRAAIAEGKRFILRIKFLRERGTGDWFVENNFDPIRKETKKDQAIVEYLDMKR